MIAATTDEGDLVSQHPDVIAITRSAGGVSAIWHVDISPATPLGRLCGAWVTDDPDTWRKVLAARLLLPFGGRVDESLAAVVDTTFGIVDVTATLATVSDRVAELDALHRASKTAAGNARAPIKWPDLPTPLDWVNLPSPQPGVNPEPFVAETIAAARWIADLADAWSSVETARISRKHLAGSDIELHPFPVALAQTLSA
jgi:hypothetical protein